MNRLFIVLPFVLLAGCRMCGSPYDYCVSAYTHRADDYRGCDVFYRAGSIFWHGGATYDGTSVDFVADRSLNAGGFGTTTPVDLERPAPRTLEPRKFDRPTIGIPPKPAVPIPNGGGNHFPPFHEQVPTDLPAPPPVPRSLDVPMPLDQTQNQGGPIVTIEELRRLDPSVTDVRILSVEDVPNPKTGTLVP